MHWLASKEVVWNTLDVRKPPRSKFHGLHVLSYTQSKSWHLFIYSFLSSLGYTPSWSTVSSEHHEPVRVMGLLSCIFRNNSLKSIWKNPFSVVLSPLFWLATIPLLPHLPFCLHCCLGWYFCLRQLFEEITFPKFLYYGSFGNIWKNEPVLSRHALKRR